MEEPFTLLRKYAKNEQSLKAVWNHSQKVRDIALQLAQNIPNLDIKLIEQAALLHDIGRLITGPGGGEQGIRHGLIGAQILRKEGFSIKLCNIVERHVGAGITKEDIIEQNLNLPKKDFMPLTKEEKIVCNADNLVFGVKEVPIEKVVERFTREVNQKIGQRALGLHREILSWKI